LFCGDRPARGVQAGRKHEMPLNEKARWLLGVQMGWTTHYAEFFYLSDVDLFAGVWCERLGKGVTAVAIFDKLDAREPVRDWGAWKVERS